MKLQIIALLFFINLQAQENLEPKTFFEYFFKNTTEKIIYTEVYFHDFEEITESLKYSSTLHKFDNRNPESKKLPDSISLTSQELKYVMEQFEQNNGKKISPSFIPNSKHISRKKVDKIFSDRDKGWTYFNKNIGKKLYSFSKPVYLRNNSICFFYFSSSCGSLCGGGGFTVYLKVDGIWYSYRSLSMWVS